MWTVYVREFECEFNFSIPEGIKTVNLIARQFTHLGCFKHAYFCNCCIFMQSYPSHTPLLNPEM